MDAAGSQEIRVLRVHTPDDPHLLVAPILANDFGQRRAKVTDLVLSSGAIAAVNGDFFTANGDIRGIAVSNGVLRSEPEAPLPSVATTRAAWRVDGPSVTFGRPSSHLGWHRG